MRQLLYPNSAIQSKASMPRLLIAVHMWPQLSAAAEKLAWEMLPDMLDQNKPTWMTSLKLKT